MWWLSVLHAFCITSKSAQLGAVIGLPLLVDVFLPKQELRVNGVPVRTESRRRHLESVQQLIEAAEAEEQDIAAYLDRLEKRLRDCRSDC